MNNHRIDTLKQVFLQLDIEKNQFNYFSLFEMKWYKIFVKTKFDLRIVIPKDLSKICGLGVQKHWIRTLKIYKKEWQIDRFLNK